MPNTTLQDLTEYLSRSEEFFQDLVKDMVSPTELLYPVDILTIAVINRSLSLISGFITLISNNNFIGAAHLVRPHLDSFLRFYAVWQVDEPHEFARKVINGDRIDKLKDKEGQLLRDSYLVELATKEFPWIDKVYKETSGYIHLSKKHIFTSLKISNEEGSLDFKFSRKDKYVKESHRIEAVQGMIEITKCINELITGWIKTKKYPPNS